MNNITLLFAIWGRWNPIENNQLKSLRLWKLLDQSAFAYCCLITYKLYDFIRQRKNYIFAVLKLNLWDIACTCIMHMFWYYPTSQKLLRRQTLSPNIVNIDVHWRQYCWTLSVGNKIISSEQNARPPKQNGFRIADAIGHLITFLSSSKHNANTTELSFTPK